MTFGTRPNGQQSAMFEYDVWNSFEGTGPDAHLTLPNGTSTDLFCSSQLVLSQTGDVILTGGDIWDATNGRTTDSPNPDVTLFRASTNTLERAGSMKRPRWYASSITLPSGEVYIQGGKGGNDRAEVRGLDGTSRLLTGFITNDLDAYYPRIFSAPDGKIFGVGNSKMFRIDPSGNGTRVDLGTLTGYTPSWQTPAVMFSPGQILMTGGDGKVAIVDLRDAAPVVSSAGSLSQVRQWANTSVLADGTVAVTGGSRVANALTDIAYHVELFDPASRSWTRGPSAQKARLYHSISLLLPDATLLTGGGGAPGPQIQMNAEIWYPPYLFGADGMPKPRPRLSSAPVVVRPASSFTMASPDAAHINRLTMVATGSTTHAFDRNQRFVELDFYRNGPNLVAQLPANRFDTPPGFYMVFAFDVAGTPSVARIVRVDVL